MAPVGRAVRDFCAEKWRVPMRIVTGCQLGWRHGEFDGGIPRIIGRWLFADANYVGCASPLICDTPGVVPQLWL